MVENANVHVVDDGKNFIKMAYQKVFSTTFSLRRKDDNVRLEK